MSVRGVVIFRSGRGSLHKGKVNSFVAEDRRGCSVGWRAVEGLSRYDWLTKRISGGNKQIGIGRQGRGTRMRCSERERVVVISLSAFSGAV